MLPRTLRMSIVVAAALSTLLTGVWGAFAEVHWPGTSISSTECRDSDYGREDASGRLAEESEGEDQQDEEERELPLFIDSALSDGRDLSIAFREPADRRPPGSRPLSTVPVRGPPASS